MHQFTWRAMGTEFTLYLPDGEREWAAGVAGELQEETRRLERQLSLYLPDSDLCYLNAHAHQQPVRVEPELFRLLQTCQSLYALTQGAFDPTITPLLRLWGFVDKQYRVPAPDAIEQALERVGMELALLEPSGCWVYYALPGVELSFGAIGKGWAIAQCVRILRELGVEQCAVWTRAAARSTRWVRQSKVPPPSGSPCRQGEPSLRGAGRTSRSKVPPPSGSPCKQGKPSLSGSPREAGGTCRRGATTPQSYQAGSSACLTGARPRSATPRSPSQATPSSISR
jgi:hypothetical protein